MNQSPERVDGPEKILIILKNIEKYHNLKLKKLSMKRKEKKRIGGEYVQRKKMCQEQK